MLLNNLSNFNIEAGSDEAGRGCLAGPVVAAAVILPDFDNLTYSEKKIHTLINDSKKLSEINRNVLRPLIENIAIDFAVTFVDEKIIDKINILNASILGMQESVLKLNPIPEFVIIDGNAPFIHKKGFFRDFSEHQMYILKKIKSSSIIKGDSKYSSIAAASVLAKTYRDEFMDKIHEEFPEYNWKKNKGYPTREHREAILKYGICKYHRLSYNIKC